MIAKLEGFQSSSASGTTDRQAGAIGRLVRYCKCAGVAGVAYTGFANVPEVEYPVLVGVAEAAGWTAGMDGGAPAALDVVLAGADWDEPECNCGAFLQT